MSMNMPRWQVAAMAVIALVVGPFFLAWQAIKNMFTPKKAADENPDRVSADKPVR